MGVLGPTAALCLTTFKNRVQWFVTERPLFLQARAPGFAGPSFPSLSPSDCPLPPIFLTRKPNHKEERILSTDLDREERLNDDIRTPGDIVAPRLNGTDQFALERVDIHHPAGGIQCILSELDNTSGDEATSRQETGQRDEGTQINDPNLKIRIFDTEKGHENPAGGLKRIKVTYQSLGDLVQTVVLSQEQEEGRRGETGTHCTDGNPEVLLVIDQSTHNETDSGHVDHVGVLDG